MMKGLGYDLWRRFAAKDKKFGGPTRDEEGNSRSYERRKSTEKRREGRGTNRSNGFGTLAA